MISLTMILSLCPAQGAGLRPRIPKPPLQEENLKPTLPLMGPFRFFRPARNFKHQPEMKKILAGLDRMLAIYLRSKDPGVDPIGRPHCSDPYFKEIKESMMKALHGQGGYLGTIVRNDGSSHNRRAAHFGALFVPDMQDCLHLISYLPLEPDPGIRRRGITLALPILQKHLGRRGPENPEEAPEPPEKGTPPLPYTYEFDAVPFLNLLRAPEVLDRLYALKILQHLAHMRPDPTADHARVMRTWIEDGLRSGKEDLSKGARAFVDELAKAHARTLKLGKTCPESPKEAVEFFTRLLRGLFPDIRLEKGLCDLFQGPDLAEVLKLGEEMLASGKLTYKDSAIVKTPKYEMAVYGIRLRVLPESLQALGLKEGMLITGINGQPVLSGKEALEALRKMRKAGMRSFVVEWVTPGGKRKAIRYRYFPEGI